MFNSSKSSHISCRIADKPNSGDIWRVKVPKLDSLKYFYVQNLMKFEQIQAICSNYAYYENDLSISISVPSVGKLIAARDENNIWYRAEVKEINESGLSVSLVDFGCVQIMAADFKNLPRELMDMEPMTCLCSLKNLSSKDEQMLMDSNLFILIIEHFTVNEMSATFFNNVEPYPIELSSKGVDVLNIISELVWEGIIPGLFNDLIAMAKYRMLEDVRSLHRNEVSRIEPIISTEHFYVETKYSEGVGKNIRNEIENEKSWTPVIHPEEGEIVVVKNEKNKKLYRARIVLNYDNFEGCKCFLIDCGTFEDCTTFFQANRYLRTAPPVKMHCSLNASARYSDCITESMVYSFIEEVTECKSNNERLTMDVIKTGNPSIVDFSIGCLKISEVIQPREVKLISMLHLNSFKVQLVSTIRKVSDALQAIDHQTLIKVKDPKFFGIYITKCNQKYKRIRYLGKFYSKFGAKLVDEDCKRITVEELYKIPEAIESIKILDIHCSLGLNLKVYSKKKFDELCILNNHKTFLMVVVKNDYMDGHIVKLFIDSKDVTTLIQEEH